MKPDRDLQIRFLAGMTDTDKGRQVYRWLRPELFEDRAAQVVADAFKRSYERSGVAPAPSTLRGLAKGTDSSLNGELEVLTRRVYGTEVDDWDSVCDLAAEWQRGVAVEDALYEAIDLTRRGSFEAAQELIAEAFSVGNREVRERIGLTGGVQRASEGEPTPTMLGLDKQLGGGLRAGELGVVIAPPKGGKSGTLVNIGYAAVMHGRRLLHVTLELSAHKTRQRYLMRLLGRTKPELDDDDVPERVEALLRRVMGDVTIEAFPTRSAGLMRLRDLLQERSYDMMIVDYADLMRPERAYSETRHALADIYYGLRGLAGQFGMPVWTASQTNRHGAGDEPITMRDFAECFEKAAALDIGLALNQDTKEKDAGVARLHLLLNRDGEGGLTVPCNVDWTRMTLTPYKQARRRAR
jgi:replicative DNA helicase